MRWITCLVLVALAVSSGCLSYVGKPFEDGVGYKESILSSNHLLPCTADQDCPDGGCCSGVCYDPKNGTCINGTVFHQYRRLVGGVNVFYEYPENWQRQGGFTQDRFQEEFRSPDQKAIMILVIETGIKEYSVGQEKQITSTIDFEKTTDRMIEKYQDTFQDVSVESEKPFSSKNHEGYQVILTYLDDSTGTANKVDIFMTKMYGQGVFLLKVAPERDWAFYKPIFDTTQDSIYLGW